MEESGVRRMRSGGAGQGGYVHSFVCGGQNEPA